ncbi:MAG: tetratricopeptide repeat protein [Verrucomicrobia bacterium]|nr:tetratricopeptide repeat protein [Verrucomicrobiota bacterium]
MAIGILTLQAAEPAEQLAFDAAIRDFELGQWERAVRSLEEFGTKFPQSTFKLEALQRRQFAAAELALSKAEYAAAAAAFADYAKTYPAGGRAGVAAIREAQAHLKLGNGAAALAVLEAPEGPFAQQLAQGTHPATLFGGLLVKAEALRAAQRWADAIAALTQADPLATTPSEKAARWQMLAGVQEAAGQLEAAAQAAEEWSRSLGQDSPIEHRAEASALAGRLWRRAGKKEAAEAAFGRNLAAGVPLDRQREAVLELADSALSRGDWATARERLQSFLNSQPADSQAARLRLQLGQTLFRQFLAGGGATNPTPELLALLPLASAQFGDGLTNSPPAEIAGPLRLGLGWSLWQEGVLANQVERIREAETNFAAAAALLPPGPEQATARFKWADSQLRLGQPAAALTNFWWVIREYTNNATVDTTLVTPALLQAAQAGVAAGKPLESATAVEQLLTRKPAESEAGNITLVVAQALGDPTRGKALLDRFLALYPAGSLAPDAELGLATIELRSRQWTNALATLDAWVNRHTNHALLPKAEFDRAWAAVQAGLLTNAVNQFAALSVRFPTNPISQTASLWLADYYFSEGDYLRSAQACVNVLTNTAWRGNPLWHQARLKAAESARRRQSFSDAQEQLVEILNDRSTPTNLVPSALFALGETQLEQPPTAEAPPLDNYRKALEAFTAAAQFTNSLVSVAALGKMADCHLQMATRSTNSYAKADELYRRVLQSPRADLAARCKASVGLGLVAEKLAELQPALAPELLKAALNAYLDVVNGTLLRPGDKLDPWWVKEAGRQAGELLERGKRWSEAAALYDQLARELPASQIAWSARAAEARKRIVP